MLTLCKHDIIANGTLEDCIAYNKQYDEDRFAVSSEATKFDLGAMQTFLSVRDKLTYTDNENAQGEWRTLQIAEYPTKYGTCYIYIDISGKQWRTSPTAGEFYGSRPPRFKAEELA